MESEHIFYPGGDHKNRTTPPTTPVEAPSVRPATRHERRILERLHAEHSAAFEAYLEHIWSGTPIEGIETDFENVYLGSYEELDYFIEDSLRTNGWFEPVEAVKRSSGIPEGLLVWDTEAFLDFIKESFELVEAGGKIHVFEA